MALPTSGTFNFQSVTAETLIRDAFENIGITSEFLDAAKYDSAKRSINLLNLEWMSKSYNLWTIKNAFIPLNQGQTTYTLPIEVSNITQMVTRTFVRQTLSGDVPIYYDNGLGGYSFYRRLGGTPQSNIGITYDNAGGGNPAFAFDGKLATACTQNQGGGNISYDFGDGNDVSLVTVAITSNKDSAYNIVIEASEDSADWTLILSLGTQRYSKSIQKFSTIQQIDPDEMAKYRYWRVRETGGNILDLEEIYFNVTASALDSPNLPYISQNYTSLAQTAPGGSVGYAYNNALLGVAAPLANVTTQAITMIGIQTPDNAVAQNYTLVVEGSTISALPPNNNLAFNNGMTTLLTIPLQNYPAGVVQWFDLPNPVPITYIQIRETADATLNIAQLYFVNNTNDLMISEISKWQYDAMPNKNVQGRPSSYYMDRGFQDPTISLWPVSDNYYTLLRYSYEQMMQDVSSLTETIEIPSKFYPAMIWGLSWRLAMKYRPDTAQALKGEYMEAFQVATTNDSDGVPFSISVRGDYL